MVNHIAGDRQKYILSNITFEPKSLITILMPGAKIIIVFEYRGKSIPCVVPAHYANWNQKCACAATSNQIFVFPWIFSRNGCYPPV
ncbi:MAG: hypothetical protein FWG10_01680 [Eubacteriaceae bacterium]|nr:hypothetical protein [Eubacteriaceae bacterium]